MAPRLDTRRFYDIPYSVYDILAQMRGAIDPDTGQIVCHFYSIGVAALETSSGPVPLIVVEGCLMLTYGPDNVEAVLRDASPREVEAITVKKGRLIIGELEIDHYWGLAALAYAREAASTIKLYNLDIAIDEEKAPIAAIRIDDTDLGPVLILIPRSCEYIEETEQPPTHM